MRAISLQLATAFAKSRHAANRHSSRFIVNTAKIFDFLPAPIDYLVQQHIGHKYAKYVRKYLVLGVIAASGLCAIVRKY